MTHRTKRGWWGNKIGRGVLAICAVVCIAAAFIGSFSILGLALGTAVTVNAPEYVEETFNATIGGDSITNFNAAQFNRSFDSRVMHVTGAADGCIEGETVPVDRWELMDENVAWNGSAVWNGYTTGDYHTLYAGKPYNDTIKTGSCPQIHHRAELEVVDSEILKCAKFTDANGNLYDDWIPATALW